MKCFLILIHCKCVITFSVYQQTLLIFYVACRNNEVCIGYIDEILKIIVTETKCVEITEYHRFRRILANLWKVTQP